MRLGALAVVAVAAGIACVGVAQGTTLTLPLDPAHAVIEFRTFAVGVWPIDGSFSRFNGALHYDKEVPNVCRVELTVDLASLALGDAALRADVLSANLLDADRYPALVYRGDCVGEGITGQLTLHGQTHPLALFIRRERASYVAQGSLQRADWGITGRPLLAGQRIRIRVSTTVPQ